MDRFMIHLKNSEYEASDARRILGWSRELTAGMERTVRDVRVAGAHVELDVSADREIIDGLVGALAPIGGKIRARLLSESEPPRGEAVRYGAAYFNSERFWESHEAFEGVWLGCERGSVERDTIQGIILAAAALVHHQKAEDDIAVSILGRAAQKLAHSPRACYGIDTAGFRESVWSAIKSGDPAPFMIRPATGRS